MRIEKIKFKNFRQYRDETINFSYGEKNKRFTVIQGAMGTGKTNILNGITWCLYSQELHLGDKYKGLPIINTITFHRMEPGQIDEVIVEIHMRDDQNNKIIFSRSFEFEKLKNEMFEKLKDYKSDPKTGTKFEIKRQVNGDIRIIEGEDAIYLTKKLFPQDIQEYFFFDGERLNDYFRKSVYSDAIKQEVFKISQISLFEKVIDHLAKRRDFFSREAKGLNPEADEIKDQKDKREQNLKEKKSELENKKRQKNEAEIIEKKFEERLKGSHSTREVSKLQEERERLDEELERLKKDIKETEHEQLNYLKNMMSIIMGYKPISKSIQLLSEKIDSGEIPPDYKMNFIKKLLDEGKCICNTDISKECEARKRVEQLLKECDELSELTEELINVKCELQRMIRQLDDFPRHQKEYSKRINNFKKEERNKNMRLKKIHDILKGIDNEKIKQLEHDYNQNRNQKEKLIGEIAVLNADIEKFGKEISILKKEHDKEVKKIEEKNELRRILLFCNEALEAAEEIKNEILEEIRIEIEKKTKKQFFEIIWKKENYSDVKIDEQYNFIVLDQNNRQALGTLSAGERQTLALAFMAALNMESGFDSPIIIDTPLGRISREPKINIAKNLPKYLEGKQVTLLVTEEEYSKKVRENLREYIFLEYIISFKDTKEGNEAKVVPYDE